jgi:quinol monooxygenase YgiN
MTTLNATAQAVLPNWVRGRGLAVYLTVFSGAMAGGSLAWGFVAQAFGIPATLLASACGLVVVALFARAMPLPSSEADLTPSSHWPEPAIAAPVEEDRGPVLVLIEYEIEPERRAAFLTALGALARQRRRDGAFNWGVTEDAADPRRVVEWFMVESWAEHLRQHRRASRADADLHAEIRRFHVGAEPLAARHLLALPPHPAGHGGAQRG